MIDVISLEDAADLIEAAVITRHDDHASAVRLDLDHLAEGKLTTIQTNGNEVFLIRHTQAEARAQ